MRILLTTWGNPITWRRIRYRFAGGGEFKCPDGEVFTPLPCYANEVDQIIIIALDSILTTKLRKGQDSYVNIDVLNCAKEVKLQTLPHDVQVSESGLLSTDLALWPEVKTYGEWIETAKNYVRCIARRVVKKEVDVVIAPAMGRLGGYVYKPRHPGYFSTISLLEIYSLLENVLPKITTIYLDVTHGINFMPTLTYLVARRLASIALTSGSQIITLQVLNAIQSEDGTYEIHRIHSEKIHRIDLAVATLMKGEEARVARALAMAAPLAIHVACRNLKKQISPQEELEKYRSEVAVTRNEAVWRKPAESLDEIYIRLLAKEICKHGWSNVLDEINPNYFLKVSKLHQIFVQDELNDLRKLLQAKTLIGDTPYYKLRGKSEEDVKKEHEKLQQPDDQFIRNFIAHAGLLDSIVILRQEGKKIVLKYFNDELVLKFLDSPNVTEFI